MGPLASPGAGPAPSCPEWFQQGGRKPDMFFPARPDGFGMEVAEMVVAMAFSHACGVRFGGVIGSKRLNTRKKHGINVSEALALMFGTSCAEPGLVEAPRTDMLPDCSGACARESCATEREVLYGFRHESASIEGVPAGSVLSPEFIGALRRWALPSLLPHATAFRGRGGLSVAFHIRRGDIRPSNPERWVPMSWYINLSSLIRDLWPRADIHAWSEGKLSDFENLSEAGVAVHADGDPMNTPWGSWAHFSAASVFVTARSAYSWVPALLNKNCVVFDQLDPFIALPSWITSPSRRSGSPTAMQVLKEQLASCVSSLG